MNRGKSMASEGIALRVRKPREKETSNEQQHKQKSWSRTQDTNNDDDDDDHDEDDDDGEDEDHEFTIENISNSSDAISDRSYHKGKSAMGRSLPRESAWVKSNQSVERPGTVNSTSTFLTSGIEYLSSSDDDQVQVKSPSSLTFKKRHRATKTPIDSGNNSFDIDVIVHQENVPKTSPHSSPFRNGKHFLAENKSSSESEVRRPRVRNPIPLPRLKTARKRNSDREDLLDAASHEPSLTSPVKTPSSNANASDFQETDDETKTPKKEASSIELKEIKSKPPEAELDSVVYSYAMIIDVLVHGCDPLVDDINKIKHPRVKVHLFHINSEKYLKKSRKDRRVSYYQEHDEIDYIMPILSQPFHFIENKTITPSWEENILFNDDFNVILQKQDPAIIMFEIMDNLESNQATSRYKKLGSEGGWRKIAWAFLKPLGSNGILNYNKKLRLQLYKPKLKSSNIETSNEVFGWWKSGNWEAYPATLYVTLQETPPPTISSSNRSRTALQQEQSRDTLLTIGDDDVDGNSHDDNDDITSTITSIKNSVQESADIIPSRLSFQTCEIPNRKYYLIKTSNKGCFCLRFNSTGTFLACALADVNAFHINVYSVLDFKHALTLYGHQELIYDLDWSNNDRYLLSASADGMTLIWNIENRKNAPEQILPHPTFIYTAKFCPNKNQDVLTGCFDNIIRVWSKPYKSNEYELSQELEGHEGFVNSICVKNAKSFLSGDSNGLLILWIETKPKSKTNAAVWQLERKINLTELENVIINRIIHHTWSERFLIHSRDNTIRMVDIDNQTVLHRYKGMLNARVQKMSCLSACGNLLFGPSEDESICVWQVDTGELVGTYSGKKWYDGVSCVDYHPTDHLLAVAMYGAHAKPIILNVYQAKMKSNIGLLLMKNSSNLKNTPHEEIVSDISFDTKSFLTSTQIETTPTKGQLNKTKQFRHLLEKMDLILDRESTPIKETNERLEKIQKKLADTTRTENAQQVESTANMDKIDENLKLLKLTLNQINIRKEKSLSSKKSVDGGRSSTSVSASASTRRLSKRASSTTKRPHSSQSEHSIQEIDKGHKLEHYFHDNVISSPLSEPLNRSAWDFETETLHSPRSEKFTLVQDLVDGITTKMEKVASKKSISSESSRNENRSVTGSSIGGGSRKTYSISSSLSSNHTYIIHHEEQSPRLFQKVDRMKEEFDKEISSKMRPYSAGPIIDINERISPARARYHKHKYLLAPTHTPFVNHSANSTNH